MAEAYIVDAIRTPVGKKNGSLSQVHPADLGAHVLKAIVERNKLDPAVVEDVVFGCLDTARAERRRHRPHLLARHRLHRRGARHDDRSPVRLLSAGRELRGDGRHERYSGRRDRGWRAEHEH